jgi:hypothetical protein
MVRSRIERIRKHGTSIYWEKRLEPYLKSMKLKFIEISLIEEIAIFEYYIGFVKVQTLKGLERYIEIVVLFDKKGRAEFSIFSNLLEKIDPQFSDGDILLCKI